jgi:hypothetical protein
MLETRYHHLLSTSVDVARARLDAFAVNTHKEGSPDAAALDHASPIQRGDRT